MVSFFWSQKDTLLLIIVIYFSDILMIHFAVKINQSESLEGKIKSQLCQLLIIFSNLESCSYSWRKEDGILWNFDFNTIILFWEPKSFFPHYIFMNVQMFHTPLSPSIFIKLHIFFLFYLGKRNNYYNQIQNPINLDSCLLYLCSRTFLYFQTTFIFDTKNYCWVRLKLFARGNVISTSCFSNLWNWISKTLSKQPFHI